MTPVGFYAMPGVGSARKVSVQGDYLYVAGGLEGLLVLDIEEGVTSRLFPGWSMKTVDLDAAAHVRLLPLKIMMQAVYEQRLLVDKMIWGIERTLQHELRSSD